MHNEPAFPTSIVLDGHGNKKGGQRGMSLRDYFAGKALVGLLSADTAIEMMDDSSYAVLANTSYNIADNMLKRRK